MYLAPKSQLYGLPARAIRDFLRHVGLGTFDDATLRVRLKLTPADANSLLRAMLADDLIDRALPMRGVPMYGITVKGGQLASAFFAPQIPRARGEQLLAGVLVRAADLETQRPFAFRVVKVALFGSMLGDEPLVSDVDLAVELMSPFEGEEWEDIHRKRVEVAEQRGKQFRTRFQSVVWPRREIVEFLRGGNRYISIHSFNELVLLDCPYRIVLQNPDS